MRWKGANADRDAKIRRLRLDGVKSADIAEAFGLSDQRVRQILGANFAPRFVSARYVDPSKTAEMLRLYECGFTLREIGERYGIRQSSVHAKLRVQEGYAARRLCEPTAWNREVEVPRWVPDPMRPRYVKLAQRHDEQTAASCIRAAKRLGVSL